MDVKTSRYFDYRYFAEFQSHYPEFDYLKSKEVKESINSLAFVHNTGTGTMRLLTTNEKVIKLWKIEERT
jgi:serine/threonine-protein phosphatase 2A regulatory subunit B